MADQHIGFPGTVNSAQLPLWLPNMGAQYSVEGPNDAKVVIGTGDRGILVKKGTIIGDGITDIFENDTPLTLAAASGTNDRWDMVVLRRTWNATPGASTSVYTVIQGGSTRTLPTRNNNKGVLADQPVALCRVRGGQTAVQEIIDLRAWYSNAGYFALDPLVLNYLSEPGTRVNIAGTTWTLKVNADPVNNTVSWESDRPGPWVNGTLYSGWRVVTNGSPFMARMMGNGLVQVVGECIYEGPGSVAENWSPGVLPPQFRSDAVTYIVGNGGGYDRTQVFYQYKGEIRYAGAGSRGPIAQFNGFYTLY